MKSEDIRRFLNERRALVIGAVVVVLAISLLMAMRPHGGEVWRDVPTAKAFFMDEETGEVSVRSREEIPPLDNAKGNPTICRAAYFKSAADAPKQLYYLEKYTPEIKHQLEDYVRHGKSWEEDITITTGHLVRRPEPGSPWLSCASPEGVKLTMSVGGGGRPAIPANP